MYARRSDRTVMNGSRYTLCINNSPQNGRKSGCSCHDGHDHFACITARSDAFRPVRKARRWALTDKRGIGLRFALSAVAAATGLALLGLAMFGQPYAYLRQAREQWDSLMDLAPPEVAPDQE